MKVTTIFDRAYRLNGCPQATWVPIDKNFLQVQTGPKAVSHLSLSDLDDVTIWPITANSA